MTLTLLSSSPAETHIRFTKEDGSWGEVVLYDTPPTLQFVILDGDRTELTPEELRTISEKYKAMRKAVEEAEKNPKLEA